ncbi:hypothetical protein ACS0TY_006485 [Phlomoides rotata]
MDKLQWGNRKPQRRAKMKDSSLNAKSNGGGGAGIVEKKISSSRVVDDTSNRHSSKEEGRDLPPSLSPHLPNRKAPMESLPVKEDRYYAKRGFDESSSKVVENQKNVWPRLLISLSSKEKEEDFMSMKGCKPSQRPKKRAKLIQRAILLASPGAWLSDVCRERYEVREKKTSKKKPRGLKAMCGMDIDSE